MADISAGLVKELRELTGLGMMECKKALTEAGGDLRKAEELLRIKGGARSKVAGRVTAEGVIGAYVSPDAKLGALVELNCETDFVAKNEDFVAFAKWLAELTAVRNPADAAALGRLEGVEEKLQALIQKIKENMSIRRLRRIQARGRLAQYLHGTKIGVLVDFEGPDDTGKDLAMH
ncbi:MAG TPA: translation elongation factor Ts, partial [Burkholderiales bacterium]|nr:translation elongation factor Ts [Burkholderiales bacterium]